MNDAWLESGSGRPPSHAASADEEITNALQTIAKLWGLPHTFFARKRRGVTEVVFPPDLTFQERESIIAQLHKATGMAIVRPSESLVLAGSELVRSPPRWELWLAFSRCLGWEAPVPNLRKRMV